MSDPYFPDSVLKKMASLGLSEKDILDVYYNGEAFTTPNGTKGMVKKYSHYKYEIGLFYTMSDFYGKYMITHVWKRERR